MVGTNQIIYNKNALAPASCGTWRMLIVQEAVREQTPKWRTCILQMILTLLLEHQGMKAPMGFE